MKTMTTKRRKLGGVHEQPKGRTQVGGSRPRQMGVANTTETRAVMTGHTVRVLVDYDGLRGTFGRVLSSGLGKVEVDVHLYGKAEPRRVVFLERELEVVPLNDTMRYTGETMAEDREVYGLIRRCTDLRMIARHEVVSESLRLALERRAQRLHYEIRCLQRARGVREAHVWVKLVGNPCSTALVTWAGKEAA